MDPASTSAPLLGLTLLSCNARELHQQACMVLRLMYVCNARELHQQAFMQVRRPLLF